MWFLVAIFVVSLAASLLLTPKAKFENARSSGINDLRFPRAEEGAPVPLVFGRVLMKGPNTAWVGDFEARAIKKKQKTGLFSSKKVIVGYTYYIGLQLILALGKCTLHKIVSDKETIWSGLVSMDGTALNINLPDLYGGKEKGGGFIGTLRYYTGSKTQPINAYLQGKIGAGLVPAYRGFSYLVLEKCNIGESNQLRALQMELSNYTNELGLTGGKHKVGDDMNPMELLYQAFTLDWGALDVDPSLLDLPSLIACGNTLYAEGNGMSLCISQPNGGKELASEVLRQVDGLMYQDPLTGKIVVKLIRNDYNIEDLPVFDESNIVVIRSFSSKLWEDTVNQVRVKYTNRDKNYEEGTGMVQDMANIHAQGRVRSITQSYPGIGNGALAVEVATRDLSQGSVPLMSASIEMNREGSKLRPGDPFLWAWDAYGIEQVVMRVRNFDLGALNDNRIEVECNQDDFAIDLTVFAPPSSEGSAPESPNVPAIAAPTRIVREGSYFFAAAAGLNLSPDQSLLIVAAEATAGTEEYSVYTSLDTVTYNPSESGIVYSPRGSLNVALTAAQNLSTGIIPSLTITSSSDEIEPVSVAEIEQGYGMFYIGAELFAHQGATDNLDGTFTLTNVRRALLDTIPTAHALAAPVWFIVGDNVIDDPFGWEAAVRVKVIPTTYNSSLPISAAPFDSITLDKRAQRPLRPANVKFGGAAFIPPASPVGPLTVTWANRNRLAPKILSIVDNTSENETGQRTVFRYRKNAGAWTTELLAPSVVTYTFDAGAIITDVVEYEIYSTCNGLDSFSKWKFTAGAAAAEGTNPDAGGGSPPDGTPPYVEPPVVVSEAMTTSEALAANDLINIHAVGGAFRVRKADATVLGKEAQGFVKAAFSLGATAEVFFEGENSGLAGLTPGVKYLSTTAGGITSVPPSASGNAVQRVGTASAAGVFIFEPGESIGLA